MFHNISDIFNCVKCQRCRLHGKMQLLGLGTALRILLLPEDLIALSRDEIVALFNTLGKFSESLMAIPHLVGEYWRNVQTSKVDGEDRGFIGGKSGPVDGTFSQIIMKGNALKAVSEASKEGLLTDEAEECHRFHPELHHLNI